MHNANREDFCILFLEKKKFVFIASIYDNHLSEIISMINFQNKSVELTLFHFFFLDTVENFSKPYYARKI